MRGVAPGTALVPRTLIPRILLSILGLDLLFSSLIGTGYVVLMDVDAGRAALATIGLLAGLWVIKVAVWMTRAAARLRPLARWTVARRTLDDAALREVAVTAYRAPLAIGTTWALLFAINVMVGTVVLYFGFADVVPLGPRTLWGGVFISLATLFGAPVLVVPLVEWLLAPLVERVSLLADERRVAIPGRGLSFRARLTGLAICLVLSPSMGFSFITYMSDTHASQRELVRHAQFVASEAALGNFEEARAAGGQVFAFRTGPADLEGAEAAQTFAELPRLSRAFAEAAAAARSGTASHPREGVVAFRAGPAGRIGVVIPRTGTASTGAVASLLVFLVISSLWGPLCAMFIARSTALPVRRLSEALARVGDGRVEEAPRLPMFHQDEIGTLAKTYNSMVDQLRELVRRAAEVSSGALDVELGVRGELGDAFRGQVASLREIVGHIAHSASLLAGAASELYGAAQEQERAAHRQSEGVEEVSRTMESLLVAATHVTESTTGVLDRAERTRETTTRTAEQITELSGHAVRIGEILELIREISGHSNLLALNAALEGVRAGDSGRSFVLIAGELRKLALRVTTAVQDVQRLVDDVRGSMSATVTATTESSSLAEGTSESARRIKLITQQQRSGTEQAEQSMRDVASMIGQSLAATQQIRTLAGDLKAQAELLTRLVERFRLPEPKRAADGVSARS